MTRALLLALLLGGCASGPSEPAPEWVEFTALDGFSHFMAQVHPQGPLTSAQAEASCQAIGPGLHVATTRQYDAMERVGFVGLCLDGDTEWARDVSGQPAAYSFTIRNIAAPTPAENLFRCTKVVD